MPEHVLAADTSRLEETSSISSAKNVFEDFRDAVLMNLKVLVMFIYDLQVGYNNTFVALGGFPYMVQVLFSKIWL